MTRAAFARPDSDAPRVDLARMALSSDAAAIALGVLRSYFFTDIPALVANAEKGAVHGDR
jgi:hypothetical protein